MAINSTSWKRLPVADRDQSFDADDAWLRNSDWAKGNAARLSALYLWTNPQASPGDKNTYRLPIADILDGRPHLIPHAVFTAAAILSGAHGGLEDVLSDQDKLRLKGVVTDIYAALGAMYKDSRVKPPWLRGGNEEDQVTAANIGVWATMPIADENRPWVGPEAKGRLWELADGDIREYRKGFLWSDTEAPDLKGSYRLPIADVVGGKLTIVPRAVDALVATLSYAPSALDIPDTDMEQVAAVARAIQARYATEHQDPEPEPDATVAAAVPVAPPATWFTDPHFQAPTPITVTADGRVMGHLAAWNVCHASFGNRCVLAPRTATNYKYFLNGSVLTADGSLVRVGKITLGTGHADIRLGWIPAADHYDNTGTAAAVVATGEDAHGIWVAGAMVPGASDQIMAELRRSPLSGDWRRVNGNLELVAALAVNTPGFPIVSLNASGEPDSILATGVVLEDGTVMASEKTDTASTPDRQALERLDDITAYVDKLNKNKRLRRYRVIAGEEVGGGD